MIIQTSKKFESYKLLSMASTKNTSLIDSHSSNLSNLVNLIIFSTFSNLCPANYTSHKVNTRTQAVVHVQTDWGISQTIFIPWNARLDGKFLSRTWLVEVATDTAQELQKQAGICHPQKESLMVPIYIITYKVKLFNTPSFTCHNRAYLDESCPFKYVGVITN